MWFLVFHTWTSSLSLRASSHTWLFGQNQLPVEKWFMGTADKTVDIFYFLHHVLERQSSNAPCVNLVESSCLYHHAVTSSHYSKFMSQPRRGKTAPPEIHCYPEVTRTSFTSLKKIPFFWDNIPEDSAAPSLQASRKLRSRSQPQVQPSCCLPHPSPPAHPNKSQVDWAAAMWNICLCSKHTSDFPFFLCDGVRGSSFAFLSTCCHESLKLEAGKMFSTRRAGLFLTFPLRHECVAS